MTKKEIQNIRPGDIIFNMSKREAYKIQEVHEGYVTYEGVPHAGSFPKTSLEKWDMVSLMRDREEPQAKEEKTGKEIELTHFEGELFSVISDFWQSYMKGEEVNVVNFVREHSPSLLEAAREWSKKEDERMLTSIIERGSSQAPFGEPALREEQMEWLMKRLKSLRPQPKAEWSEEDEEMVDAIIDAIPGDFAASDYKEMVDWLKSLKDRVQSAPHWKPSEEQMKALMWQIKNTSEGSWQRRVSEDLYNDLQKLL